MLDAVVKRFRSLAPATADCEYCALRLVEERSERITVRQNVLQPVSDTLDIGGMVTVFHRGSYGYAATSNLSDSGLRDAINRARRWAADTQPLAIDYHELALPHASGDYRSPVEQPWDSLGLDAKIDLLQRSSRALKTHDSIVDWEAGLWHTEVRSRLLTNGGGEASSELTMLFPRLAVTANEGRDTQTRTIGMYDKAQQGGMEVLDRLSFSDRSAEIADDVVALLHAPNCPTGNMDLVLAPDQMMLQIHESIGHPLELDRILGDERNYAGTSFVDLDMFGTYQYGSSLLNVTFDPSIDRQLASYGYDDDGVKAEKTFIIRNGLLERPLGSAFSQARAGGIAGTANSRATSWNRPPINRMANLNVEPGRTSMSELISGVENGVLMTTNKSWSIDDSRNKFQFGCEIGQRIENGELTTVVKNPNYRGISATFWRNLSAVGDPGTFAVMGTPYCGKGEPNQVIRVGHASPVCRFSDVDVFGGE